MIQLELGHNMQARLYPNGEVLLVREDQRDPGQRVVTFALSREQVSLLHRALTEFRVIHCGPEPVAGVTQWERENPGPEKC